MSGGRRAAGGMAGWPRSRDAASRSDVSGCRAWDGPAIEAAYWTASLTSLEVRGDTRSPPLGLGGAGGNEDMLGLPRAGYWCAHKDEIEKALSRST